MRQKLKELSKIIQDEHQLLKKEELELSLFLKKVEKIELSIINRKNKMKTNLVKMKELYSKKEKSKLKII